MRITGNANLETGHRPYWRRVLRAPYEYHYRARKVSRLSGILDFDPENPEITSVEATIPVSTLQTGTPDRDKHLLSADFFDVANFPVMTFKSTAVELAMTKNQARLVGDLTIGRVTRSVTLEVEYFGQDTSLEGETRIGFTATTWVNREDFGLTWNRTLSSGNWLIDKSVKLTLDVQATLIGESVTDETPAEVSASL